MKHISSSSSRYLVPERSPVCDLVCDHRPAMREMARERSLVTQLRAIVLPALQADDRRHLVAHIFESILDCSRKAMSHLDLQPDADRADDVSVDEKRRVRKMISAAGCGEEETIGKPRRKHKRRRFGESTVSLETPVPHYDGHQWRKYGQKHINNAKHSRSYYRCAYRQEQVCKATKTVQQQDGGSAGAGADHPAMYTVVYHGQHTCSNGSSADVGGEEDAVETASTTQVSQCNNISVTTSVVDDGQASLHSELLDMPELMTTEQLVEQHELFDMAATYATLDLDTWEMDGHVRFGDR